MFGPFWVAASLVFVCGLFCTDLEVLFLGLALAAELRGFFLDLALTVASPVIYLDLALVVEFYGVSEKVVDYLFRHIHYRVLALDQIVEAFFLSCSGWVTLCLARGREAQKVACAHGLASAVVAFGASFHAFLETLKDHHALGLSSLGRRALEEIVL